MSKKFVIAEHGNNRWGFTALGYEDKRVFKTKAEVTQAADDHVFRMKFYLVMACKIVPETGGRATKAIPLAALTVDEAFSEAKKILTGDPSKWVVDAAGMVRYGGDGGLVRQGYEPVFARIMVAGGFVPVSEYIEGSKVAEQLLRDKDTEFKERAEYHRLKAKYRL
jgi:hypothetical protein